MTEVEGEDSKDYKVSKENLKDSEYNVKNFKDSFEVSKESKDSKNNPKDSKENAKKYENADFHNYKVPDDYKVHCFDENLYMQVDTDRFTNHTRTIFDKEWNKMPFGICFPMPNFVPQKPKRTQEMFKIARILGHCARMVRVDLYNLNGRIIVGELTFTHGGGTELFTPNEWDYILGEKWQIL